MADKQDQASEEQPKDTKSITFVCRICRKPLELDFMSQAMMQYFKLPADSGAHARCLGVVSDMKPSDPDTKKKGNSKSPKNQGGV